MKRKFRIWKYKYFGKWKLVDESKYFIIPKTEHVFILTEEQRNTPNVRSFTFVPGPIGDAVYANLKDGSKIDITDYDTW